MGSVAAGCLLVVSGPSGVGKTVLCDRLLDQGVAVRAITATTRAPRAGEKHGEHYLFFAREDFEQGVREGRFLEHAEVYGNLYGVPRESLEEQLAAGKHVLLNIDVQGAETLMKQGTDATYVFVLPPSLEELERRLRSRGSDDAEAIRVRLDTARREMELQDNYDVRVVNDDLDRAVEELAQLLEAA